LPVDTTPGWAVKKEIIAGGFWTLFPSGKCRRDMLAQASLWATSQIQTQKLHFWYDERNLPVQIGDNEYRYTAKPVLSESEGDNATTKKWALLKNITSWTPT